MTSIQDWGKHTWIFIHTLAAKIAANHFSKVKNKIISLILNICKNLPCPACSQHADIVLKQAYITNISTKSHLIEFLRQFHNIVNIKLHKPNRFM